MNRTFAVTSLLAAITLSACTTTAKNTPLPSTISSPNAAASTTPSPTPTAPAGCYYQEVQCIQAPCDPVLVCQSASPTSKSTATTTPKASTTTKSEVKSNSTVNSNTNISVNSNNVKVDISNKNGEKWAQVTIDGKIQEVKLDDNGCYDYDNKGNKIHVCI